MTGEWANNNELNWGRLWPLIGTCAKRWKIFHLLVHLCNSVSNFWWWNSFKFHELKQLKVPYWRTLIYWHVFFNSLEVQWQHYSYLKQRRFFNAEGCDNWQLLQIIEYFANYLLFCPQNMQKRRAKTEKEKKLGHRRVGVGGEITYKKVIIVISWSSLRFVLEKDELSFVEVSANKIKCAYPQ